MPRGDKSSYSPKQRRQAAHIEASEKKEGRSTEAAERIAWATVNKQDGGAKGRKATKKAAKKSTAKKATKKAAKKSTAKKATKKAAKKSTAKKATAKKATKKAAKKSTTKKATKKRARKSA